MKSIKKRALLLLIVLSILSTSCGAPSFDEKQEKKQNSEISQEKTEEMEETNRQEDSKGEKREVIIPEVTESAIEHQEGKIIETKPGDNKKAKTEPIEQTKHETEVEFENENNYEPSRILDKEAQTIIEGDIVSEELNELADFIYGLGIAKKDSSIFVNRAIINGIEYSYDAGTFYRLYDVNGRVDVFIHPLYICDFIALAHGDYIFLDVENPYVPRRIVPHAYSKNKTNKWREYLDETSYIDWEEWGYENIQKKIMVNSYVTSNKENKRPTDTILEYDGLLFVNGYYYNPQDVFDYFGINKTITFKFEDKDHQYVIINDK